MVSMNFFFFFMVVVFAIIGAMRGWAKEMMVTFSFVLAMFILNVIETLVPIIRDSFAVPGSMAQFWLRTLILLVLVFFGYQTPNLPKLGGTRFARERLQDALLGVFLGGLNGYLIIGTLWFFMSEANYPFPKYVINPVDCPPGMCDAALRLLPLLPPVWLKGTTLYILVAVAFVFVIVVFI
jgi:hypothetical protein